MVSRELQKAFLGFSWLVVLFIGIGIGKTPAQATAQGDEGTGQASLTCPQRMQMRMPQRCTAGGRGAELVRLARQGIRPAHPLPTVRVDPSFGSLPYGFVRVGDWADLFPSAEEAANSGSPSGRVGPGFVYLSQRGPIYVGNVVVYASESGFVRDDQVSDPLTPASFRGLSFSRTPIGPFGWVIEGGVCPSSSPGGEPNYSQVCLTKYAIVQIYDIQRVGEWDWYLVGPDQWLEQRKVAKVDPDSTRPAGVDADRWISVNLFEQTATAYIDGRLVYATLTSTGRYGYWTQPGLFQVWAKLDRDLMTGGIPGEDGSNFYYLESVPWVLYFDKSRALHGTYWHNKFGKTTSRGCVNLSIADARWFYEFAQEGTWVYVWDPSGKTPTDPAAYTEGGA